MTPRVGEGPGTQRPPESDRAAEPLDRVTALGKAMMGVEIESEGAAARRRETLRHQERESGGAAPADKPLLAPQGPPPQNAHAPVSGAKPLALNPPPPCPRGTHQRAGAPGGERG